MNKPRILFFDIETTPNLAFVWDLGKQYVNYDNLYKERKVSVICYKWSNSKNVESLTMNLNKHNLLSYDDDADKEMLKRFVKVYDQADLTVGHNALKFDIATIRSRLVKHGLTDISPVILDDTYLASINIRFNSHKLDYLSKYLELGRKASNGFHLWTAVMNGDKQALDQTVSYCKQDVLLTERVYKRVLPYIKTRLNKSIFTEDSRICPSCGQYRLILHKLSVSANHAKRIQYRCTNCGKYSTSGKNQIKRAIDFPKESSY